MTESGDWGDGRGLGINGITKEYKKILLAIMTRRIP